VHSTNIPLIFYFQSLFILQFDCALSLQDLYDTVAVLRFPFRLSLLILAIIVTCRWKWLGVEIGVVRRRVVERPRVGNMYLYTHILEINVDKLETEWGH
jgi:hypothetical protein